MSKNDTPDYVFELSWEVCNKVGGIHTVLASLAPTMGRHFGDNAVYIGPDLDTTEFIEDKNMFPAWTQALKAAGLRTRLGRWDIASQPVAILVEPHQYINIKNDVYGDMWNCFRVDSLHAYGDYDEASMWAYAAGRVIETIVKQCIEPAAKVVLQAHEWLSSMGMLYIKKAVPCVATVFTTHATSIGRSICGNGKCLYKYLEQYDGDIMARELNMQSKHSSEKAAAMFADCFTTVSSITDRECRALLSKSCDVILPNGFDTRIVPNSTAYKNIRATARRKILKVVGALTGKTLSADTLIVSTSGRNDYRPKGFDVYLEAMRRLNETPFMNTDVVALVEVPCWVECPRQDLKDRLAMQTNDDGAKPLPIPYITHNLHNLDYDRIICTIRSLRLDNAAVNGKVHVLLIPTYLNGSDGIFNMKYYDMLIGCDFTIYPSYYEPWGYTPMESAAFHVPTITTDLAGFGCWVNETTQDEIDGIKGVTVLHRDDDNYFEIAENIKNTILKYNSLDAQKRKLLRHAAAAIVKCAEWETFMKNYMKAFAFALARIE